jgi:hypothetical protein
VLLATLFESGGAPPPLLQVRARWAVVNVGFEMCANEP